MFKIFLYFGSNYIYIVLVVSRLFYYDQLN